MTFGPLQRGLLRATGIAGGFTGAALVLGRVAWPPLRAAAMLALAAAFLVVLRREDRSLSRVIRDHRALRERPRRRP
jgi:hypothetical protein